MSYSINIINEAIRDNKEDDVKKHIQNGIIPNINALNESIIYNNKKIIDLILNTKAVQPTLYTLNLTILRCNIYMFNLLIEKYNIIPDDSTMNELNGILNYDYKTNYSMLTKLIEKNVLPTKETLISALYSPNLDIIKVICNYVPPQVLDVHNIEHINSDSLQYLKDKGYQIEKIDEDEDKLF